MKSIHKLSKRDLQAQKTWRVSDFSNTSSPLAHHFQRCMSTRDTTEISGLTREALYKALRPNSQPRFDTILRVCNALGVQLVAQVQHAQSVEP